MHLINIIGKLFVLQKSKNFICFDLYFFFASSSAYNLLMEVRATDTNIMEVKTVGGFINFKICKLAFQLNLPRDAISQFRRHMDIFQHRVGLEELSFEHRGLHLTIF